MLPLHELVADSIEALRTHYTANKLLLVHPSSRYRTLVIAALINDPPCDVYFYGLGPEDVNLPQFLAGLTHDLADQEPMFGRHINEIRQQTDDFEALAAALARDLAELNQDHYLLILDEYDRADDAQDVQAFIEYLLDHLPEQCHLLVTGRTLPRLPWVALVAKHQAVVLRDARMVTSGLYADSTAEAPGLEVHALGPGYVLVNGQPVKDWEGLLPRLLFFFVLDRPMATRADICQAFWPELETEQAVNVFHVTKRRLHKVLGFDVLLHEGSFYRINPDIDVQYDVLDFVESLVAGRATTEAEDAAAAWQQAIDTYRGVYLQGNESPWIVSRRDDFRQGYLEALMGLARIQVETNELEHALGLYLRAVGEYPNREDVHREIIRLYGQLGRRSEAAEHYMKLERNMREQFGIDPSPETQAVYEEVIS
jgi:DNA-binding SARP family transcriptional activator